MAITLIGSNLNTYGNAGQFETDRSTWGFPDTSHFEFTRSSLHKTAGLYAARARAKTTQTGSVDSVKARHNFETGKNYIAKAKVRVPATTPISADTAVISLYNATSYLFLSLISKVDTTVLAAKDTWTDIEFRFTSSINLGSQLAIWVESVGGLIGNGLIDVDEFVIYEFTGEDDPGGGDPPPEPEPNPYEIDKVFFSKNPIVFQKTAPAGWELLTNFRLYNDIRVEVAPDSGVFTSKLKVDLRPDSDGTVDFYQNEAFADVFSFTPPDHNSAEIVRLTDRIKRFKNFTGTLKGTETTPPGALDESEINLVLWGGLSKRAYPGFNYFTTFMTENMKFLTWAPLIKEVDRLQEDYLNFWVYGEFTILKLQVKAYFDDGTDQTAVTVTKTDTLYTELYQIPAGPANCGVTLIDPTKNVSKYELCLLDQADNVISETRTYMISALQHPLTRYFMYRNSLGSFEVLRFTGKAEQQFSFNRTLNQKFLPHNYTAESQEIENDVTYSEEKTSYSSGFIKNYLAEDWHKYMKDFLLSTLIYDVTTGERIPVAVAESEYKIEDQEYLRYIRFQTTPAFLDECYTPEQ